MSSHHFVREGQEPALFIAEPIDLELIEPLLEWAPLVMVLDSCIDEVLRWGTKIDVALVKTTELESVREKLIAQAPVKILTYSPDDDPLLTSFYLLTRLKQTAVNIVHKAPDKIIGLAEGFLPQLSIVLIAEQMKWSGIASGQFEKWLPAHTKLYLRGNHKPTVEEGVTHIEDHYETLTDGMVRIYAESLFWVGEAL
ncbi:MAG: hypothetical protein ACOYXT_10905 [Bacteroidota bacterium]